MNNWKYRRTRAGLPCAVALLAIAAAPAGAVTIFNVTTSTVLFQDNFETGAFNASVGSWNLVGPDVTVTNSTTPPDPGPIEGSFYAQLFRDSNENGQGNLKAAPTSPQANPGDVIRLSMMLYIPSVSDADAFVQIFLDDTDFNTARAWVRPDGNGHVVAVGPGFAEQDTGLLYSTNTWQEWDLQYAIGAGTFSVSVNGLTASGFSSVSSGTVSFAEILNGVSATPGSFFVDAVPPATSGVPEPSSAGLAALALTGLLLRLRK